MKFNKLILNTVILIITLFFTLISGAIEGEEIKNLPFDSYLDPGIVIYTPANNKYYQIRSEKGKLKYFKLLNKKLTKINSANVSDSYVKASKRYNLEIFNGRMFLKSDSDIISFIDYI